MQADTREQRILRVAEELLAARSGGRPIVGLDPACRLGSIDEAQRVQEIVASRLGERIAGWKAALHEDRAVRGILIASTVLPDGGALAGQPFIVGFEAELAFRFEDDLPPRFSPYSRSEVMAAVSILPAIEIVGSRFEDPRRVGTLDILADFNNNAGFVAGAPIRHWSHLDLMTATITFSVDGKVVAHKTGGHPAGDPFAPALALANELRSTTGIAAGQYITTGAPAGCIPVPWGSTIEIDFALIGSARLRLAPAG